MRFILDECIPVSALDALYSMGLRAEMITDHIAPQSKDTFVVATADRLGAIVISHDRDFKSLISRRPDGQIRQYRNVHLVKMDCKQPRINGRLNMVMPILKAEFQERQSMRDKRMIVWVGTDMVKVWR